MSGTPTPGPWSFIVSKTLIHIETRHDNPAGAGIHICSLPKTKKADAELIFKAPELEQTNRELLDALVRLKSFVRETILPNAKNVTLDIGQECEWNEIVRTVDHLSRAEGRERV